MKVSAMNNSGKLIQEKRKHLSLSHTLSHSLSLSHTLSLYSFVAIKISLNAKRKLRQGQFMSLRDKRLSFKVQKEVFSHLISLSLPSLSFTLSLSFSFLFPSHPLSISACFFKFICCIAFFLFLFVLFTLVFFYFC